MACVRIAFPDLAWSAGAHPLERKKSCGERPIALLEFAPGFADPNPCERAHVLFVLSGALELELADGVQRVDAGEGCWLDRGTVHRARACGRETTRVLVVSDVEVRP
jgi:mannose-6-phosphate isomerase-like protein (cupin superfamily)